MELLEFEGNKIPNYLMDTESTDTNVFETSFVTAPATDRGFLMFSRDESAINKLAPANQNFTVLKEEHFAIIDNSYKDESQFQRMTSGVWMMPDTKYLRRTDNGEIYTVEFTKETLKAALLKYLKSGYANLVKDEHSGEYLDGFVAIEHWIIESVDTKSPVFGLSLKDLGYKPSDIPVGTVMKTTYVANEQYWNDRILSGEIKGYSIGGLFNLKPVDEKQQSFRKEGFPDVTTEESQKQELVDDAQDFQKVEVKVEVEVGMEVCDNDEHQEEESSNMESDIIEQESNSVLQTQPVQPIMQTVNEDFANVVNQLQIEMASLKEELSKYQQSSIEDKNTIKDLTTKLLDTPIKSTFNSTKQQTSIKPTGKPINVGGKTIYV